MKVEFPEQVGNASARPRLGLWQVTGETRRLTDVMLSRPEFLEPVACCSVTRESLREGFVTDRERAVRQHLALQRVLEAHGVTCHLVPAIEGAPDLAFTRDVAVTTPWGVVALNPALPHRRIEVDCMLSKATDLGARPVMRVTAGTIEGGDVCIVRPGLVVIGCSGERTDLAGTETLAGFFRHFGWEVIVAHFDPHFLHLDTVFCMLDERTALACTDVLDDAFLAELAMQGIRLLPVTYKESRRLGCNIVSLDGRTILMPAAQERIAKRIADAGFDPVPVDVSEFAACGGGVHCLTMPLARAANG